MTDSGGGMTCPACETELQREQVEGGSRPTCPDCGGAAITVALLRRIAPRDRVNSIWQDAAIRGEPSTRACPACRHPLRVGRIVVDDDTVELDGCRRCQLLWFDGSELESFSPERSEPDPSEPDASTESHERWMREHRRQMSERLDRTMDRMANGSYLSVSWY